MTLIHLYTVEEEGKDDNSKQSLSLKAQVYKYVYSFSVIVQSYV